MESVSETEIFYVNGVLLCVVLITGLLSGLLALKAIGVAGFKTTKRLMVLAASVIISLCILFILEAIFSELRFEIPDYFFAVLAGCCCFLGTFLSILAVLFVLHRKQGIST